MTPTRIFDGQLLRAQVDDHMGERLLVTFDHRRMSRPPERFLETSFSERLAKKGISQLRILTAQNDWYANAETQSLEAVLAEHAAQFDTVHMLGFSMGGYGAFRFAKTMGASTVVGVSPLAGIWDDIRLFDRRYDADLAGSDRVAGELAPHACPQLSGVIAVDSTNSKDLMHAKLLQIMFPKVKLARMAFAGHPAGAVIREGGSFNDIVVQATSLTPSASKLVNKYRAVRRRSPSYFRRRASRLKSRWPDLAKQARQESENLQR